jgi:long-chain acyl-CoA synthetase
MSRPHPWEAVYPPGLVWDLAPPASTLDDHLARAAATYADRTLIDYRGFEMSYAEFADRVRRAAAGLLHLGVQRGERLALYLTNTPYQPISFYAAIKAGAVVVNLSPLDSPRELAYTLKDSGARMLITVNLAPLLAAAVNLLHAGLVDRVIVGDDAAFGMPPGPPFAPLPSDDPRIVNFAALEAAPPPAAWPRLEPDDLAVLQYTGGTTGLPKGAMHTHRTLGAAVASAEQFTNAQVADAADTPERVIVVLPLFHVYALLLLLWHVGRGSVLSIHPRFDVEAVLRDIEEKRATNFPGVPTMWIALNSVPGIERRDFSSLRQVGSGGAPLPPDVAQRFERLVGRRLGGGWGMTETATAGTANLLVGLFREASIGVPLPGIEIEIVALDDPRRVLPIGETGELRVRGPNVFKGYWNQPEETAAAFVDGFFLTGDIGRMDAEGVLYLVDRKKDMIISGGYNVYPRLIEDAIYEHPAVAEACVIGVPDEYRGQAAKAFIALRAGAQEFSLEQLREFLGERLGRHELPAALEFRASLPKTAVGKLSKKDLLAER